MKEIDKFAKECFAFCNGMGFTKDWVRGGCYMHLEVSEFIEALRGKRGDPLEELGDVLQSILSVAEHHGLSPTEAIQKCRSKMNNMLNEKGV